MRVLSILPFSPPALQQGGAERQMHSLHKGLLARGVEVHVLADIREVGSDYLEFEGIHVWGVPFPVLTSHPLRPGNLKIWKAWREIRRTVITKIPHPDIIHVTTFRQPAMIGYWLADILNVPWLVRVAGSGSHGDFTFMRGNWLTRFMMSKMQKTVSRVIALEEHTHGEIIAAGIPVSRVKIIRNGLVLRKAKNSQYELLSGDDFVIAYVGRLAHEKRVDTLLEAYGGLLASFSSRRKISLVIAGGGDTSASLENLAGQIGLTDGGIFIGPVSGPEDVLEKASCFINPSESEGLPNAVLEALAFGVPVILSDIPVHRQIATAIGMGSFLFPVGDAVALANSIKTLSNMEEGQLCELRRRCFDYGQRFTPQARDDAYLNLYKEVLSEQARK